MAIMNKSTGNYLKVIRDLTTFTPRSVQVAFYNFASRSDRDKYFTRKQAVTEFLSRGNEYVSKKFAELNSEIEKYATDAGLQGMRTLSELPANLYRAYKELDSLSRAIHQVDLYWKSAVTIPGVKSAFVLDALNSLGFDSAWEQPLNPCGVTTVNTGVYSNQDFSYPCLYSELKKVFRGYVDC